MSVTVGIDTYIAVEDADAYIAAHYTSQNSQRAAWELLSDADKEVHLRCALFEIESLKYTGMKRCRTQQLEFPRTFLFCYQDAVPEEIIYAQAEEALELASPTEATDIAVSYGSNVKSYSLGSLSETLRTCESGALRAVIKSPKAQKLLMKHMGGGYRVG